MWEKFLKCPGYLSHSLKISAEAEGNLTATFDSPDQASVNVPVSKVTFINDTLYTWFV
jgi:hypothetical protein